MCAVDLWRVDVALHGAVQCTPCSVAAALHSLHSADGQWDSGTMGQTFGRTGGTVGPAVGGALDAGWKWCPGGGDGGLEHLVAAVIMTLEQLLCTA